jgi:monoamine oxidase
MLKTRVGDVRARAALLTVSTEVLANGTIKLPAELDAWRNAAARLPLGRNEKLFFEILGDAPFETETQVIGNPRDTSTAAYYLRPLGRPVIEAFFGSDGARKVDRDGIDAAFAFALDQLAALFGSDIRGKLRPLAASAWSRDNRIGGGYSYAVPGSADARAPSIGASSSRVRRPAARSSPRCMVRTTAACVPRTRSSPLWPDRAGVPRCRRSALACTVPAGQADTARGRSS